MRHNFRELTPCCQQIHTFIMATVIFNRTDPLISSITTGRCRCELNTARNNIITTTTTKKLDLQIEMAKRPRKWHQTVFVSTVNIYFIIEYYIYLCIYVTRHVLVELGLHLS